jgi:lactate dehydrogenase-like 2-hydroxyacid dehydrogenase
MQFIKALLNGDFSQRNFSYGEILQTNKDQIGSVSSRLRVGIIGTGKIGVDLLVKVRRSPWMECVVFSGRNVQSVGMSYAAEWVCLYPTKELMLFLSPAIAAI